MIDISSQLILNSVIAGAVYALIAVSFDLVYSVTKFFSLTHGVMATIGGYAVLYLVKNLDLNIYIAVFVGVILAGFVGYSLDKFVYSILRKRKASNMTLLVASLGAMTVLQAIIAILFSGQFKTISSNIGTEKKFLVFDGVITQTQIIVLLFFILIAIGLILLLYKTKFGKAVRAISDDEEGAKIVGIDTSRIIGRVFFIGSAIAGLVGALIGFDTGIEPTMGFGLLLKGVIASIVGGVGNIYGGILGGFLLSFVENFAIWKISGEWKDAIAFTLFIVFLIFRPRGIMNK